MRDFKDRIITDCATAHPLLRDVVLNHSPCVWFLPDRGFVQSIDQQPVGILSGAFDPLHVGHSEMRKAAEQHLQGPVCYELPIVNADKPPLDYLTIESRLQQFDHPIALSTAPTFYEKSEIFPHTTFVVGIDTAKRVLMSKFYEDEKGMLDKLGTLKNNGCQFLVAGRDLGSGFEKLGNLDVPSRYQGLFEELPESAFRHDVSSTSIRTLNNTRR